MQNVTPKLSRTPGVSATLARAGRAHGAHPAEWLDIKHEELTNLESNGVI